jgi:hypothetical protein
MKMNDELLTNQPTNQPTVSRMKANNPKPLFGLTDDDDPDEDR